MNNGIPNMNGMYQFPNSFMNNDEIRNLEIKVNNLERDLRRLEGKVNNLEQNKINPYGYNSNYQPNSNNMF